jgi:hypothetical protein
MASATRIFFTAREQQSAPQLSNANQKRLGKQPGNVGPKDYRADDRRCYRGKKHRAGGNIHPSMINCGIHRLLAFCCGEVTPSVGLYHRDGRGAYYRIWTSA